MLTKKQFLERLNYLMDYQKKVDKFDEALREFAPSDFTGFHDDDVHTHLLNTLVEDMNDKDDYISWWLYDCPNAGKNPEHAKIWLGDENDPDTIVVDVSTPEKLYDYIHANYGQAPSKDTMRTIIKSQDNGFKFALKHINDLKEANSETGNVGWEDRDSLFDFILKTITNDYLYARGTGADLNYHDSLYIISMLDKES